MLGVIKFIEKIRDLEIVDLINQNPIEKPEVNKTSGIFGRYFSLFRVISMLYSCSYSSRVERNRSSHVHAAATATSRAISYVCWLFDRQQQRRMHKAGRNTSV